MIIYFTHYIRTKYDKATNEKTKTQHPFPNGKISKEDGLDLIRQWNANHNSYTNFGFDYSTKTIE